MKIHYDLEKLNTIANDLFELLHLSVLFIDRDGRHLTKCYDPKDFCSVIQNSSEEAHLGCRRSDAELVRKCRESGKTCMHVCHMNLCDLALPITKNGTQVAYVLLGRMRGADCNEPTVKDSPELTSLYYKLPYFTNRELQSLKSLLSVVLFSGAITFEESDTLTKISAYIEENLSDDLSLTAICKRFFISKNTLYKLFRKEHGCTIGEFISARRLEKAKQLLKETNDTILSIGRDLGFSGYSYFCRFFKSGTGITPGEYRANHLTHISHD